MILACIFLFSCNESKEEKSSRNETPEVLKDDNYVSAYSRSRDDLVQELYSEMLEKSDTLKKLENDLNEYETEKTESTQKFDKYDSKSKSYYVVAESNAKQIKDSLLKKRISLLIESSKNNYQNKTKGLSSLLKQIVDNNTKIEDYYSVLKIVKTLPLVEKYQSDNLLKTEEYKKLFKKQNRLMQQIQTLTPKY